MIIYIQSSLLKFSNHCFFICRWLRTFMQLHKSYFENCGQFYLSTKDLNFDTWIEAINEGHKGDVLTLYGLSSLTNMHTYIHLHNGQFWSTLKNVPSTHDETLWKCKVHALYLGRGLLVELREWEVPLQIIDNPTLR